MAVSRARRVLDLPGAAESMIESEGQAYRLNLERATVDAQAFWKARDIDSGHGIRDSSGWEMTVAPGVRLTSGLIVLQGCVPFLLRTTIYERNHQRFRVVVTLGLVF